MKPFILTWIKDSNQFLNYVTAFVKLQKNGRLPSNARFVTADAISMYTNIDTGHALKVLRWFLEELKREGKLPPDFDIDMIIEAATIVMRWNIVEFGDAFLKQLIGTAMGTPVEVTWATIYFYWHEIHVLIPKYGRKMILNYRFVDDICALALFGGDDGFSPDEFDEFKQDINDFGLLRWEVNE